MNLFFRLICWIVLVCFTITHLSWDRRENAWAISPSSKIIQSRSDSSVAPPPTHIGVEPDAIQNSPAGKQSWFRHLTGRSSISFVASLLIHLILISLLFIFKTTPEPPALVQKEAIEVTLLPEIKEEEPAGVPEEEAELTELELLLRINEQMDRLHEQMGEAMEILRDVSETSHKMLGKINELSNFIRRVTVVEFILLTLILIAQLYLLKKSRTGSSSSKAIEANDLRQRASALARDLRGHPDARVIKEAAEAFLASLEQESNSALLSAL